MTCKERFITKPGNPLQMSFIDGELQIGDKVNNIIKEPIQALKPVQQKKKKKKGIYLVVSQHSKDKKVEIVVVYI